MATSITVKVIIGLVALIIVVRLLGKKELSQVTPLDFIYLLVLGGLMEETIYDEVVPFWEMLYAIGLWAILIYIFELIIRKFDRTRVLVEGKPSLIIDDGEIDTKILKKNKLESEQLRTMLREQGIFSIQEVKYAILEPSGKLSVLKDEHSSPVTPDMLSIEPKKAGLTHLVIDEGRIEKKTLERLNKDEDWLLTELSKLGYEDVSKIYYAEWSEVDGLIVRGVSE
ncbi:DUF421 domain-containing protein [Oceanobacillus sp. CAU 1775]